ncbi:hypothetical protein J7E97_24655 [Streptomyces sp. ISL-66]|uniref:hypothetical protein n=1 Tax=Streptomyces sp. ISL-66 TaxID=2819186 RepID=UPI001BE9CE73|nr:hypothetical protein [Streptomyces sp. ISL-66]MBT2470963.1 hypothetical protein [Streptomyces sp. ISL-66]
MQTTTAPPAETARTRVPAKKDALQAIVTLLGLGGVLLTGIQYWAVDRYLAQFGVTPEEVGLDTAVLLTRAATALAFLGFLIVPLLLFWPGMFTVGMAERSNRSRASRFVLREFRRRPGLRTLALAALVGLGWTAVAALDGPGALLHEGLWAMMWVAGTLIAAPALHLAGKHRTLGPLLRMCLVAFLLTGLCLTCLGDAMEKRGMQTAESARPSGLAYLLGIRPQIVRADFAETVGNAEPADGPMLYLGQAAGVHVLYDCATSTVIRKTAVQVQLTSQIGRGQEILALEVERSCRR